MYTNTSRNWQIDYKQLVMAMAIAYESGQDFARARNPAYYTPSKYERLAPAFSSYAFLLRQSAVSDQLHPMAVHMARCLGVPASSPSQGAPNIAIAHQIPLDSN